jgi:hypothetical protein
MYSYELKYDVLDDNGNYIETKSYQKFKSYYTRAFSRQSHEGERAFRGDAYKEIAAKVEGLINRVQEENNQRRKGWVETQKVNPGYRAPKPPRLRYLPYNQINVGIIRAGSREKGQKLPEDSDGRAGDPTQNRI